MAVNDRGENCLPWSTCPRWANSESVPELYQAIHALLVSKGLTKSAKALGKEAELLEDTPAAQEQVQKLLGAWELINVTV